jgi:hypothetical protein
VGEDTPMTRSVVTALLLSGLMGLATLGIAVLHAIMFATAASSTDRDGGPSSATGYLWLGTILAASTAAAAAVLYRAPWRPLTAGRWMIIVLAIASAVGALGLWIAFWSAY